MNRRLVLLLLLSAVALNRGAYTMLELSRYWRACQLAESADLKAHAGQRAAAIALYRRCLEEYPDMLSVYQELAELYMEGGEWQKALDCVEAAVRRCPREHSSLAIVHRQRAVCLWRAGRCDDCRQALSLALHYDPGEPLARQLLDHLDKKRDRDASFSL